MGLYHQEPELRFHCLDCMDAGIVTVYNPHFVEWLRPTFEEWGRVGFPAGWFIQVSVEWYRKALRKETARPAMFALACCCDCVEARIYRKQLAQLQAGEIKRSAYPGAWSPVKQCRFQCDPQEDLASWYAEHRPNESYEWQADPLKYAGNVDEF